jgi:hypothetical protein
MRLSAHCVAGINKESTDRRPLRNRPLNHRPQNHSSTDQRTINDSTHLLTRPSMRCQVGTKRGHIRLLTKQIVQTNAYIHASPGKQRSLAHAPQHTLPCGHQQRPQTTDDRPQTTQKHKPATKCADKCMHSHIHASLIMQRSLAHAAQHALPGGHLQPEHGAHVGEDAQRVGRALARRARHSACSSSSSSSSEQRAGGNC